MTLLIQYRHRYYISQQLTDKSDVYSFGVILLELISGQEAISNEKFGVNCRNIVQWVRFIGHMNHLLYPYASELTTLVLSLQEKLIFVDVPTLFIHN